MRDKESAKYVRECTPELTRTAVANIQTLKAVASVRARNRRREALGIPFRSVLGLGLDRHTYHRADQHMTCGLRDETNAFKGRRCADIRLYRSNRFVG